jgi:UDP-N-acetylmuramate dehydrogenase
VSSDAARSAAPAWNRRRQADVDRALRARLGAALDPERIRRDEPLAPLTTLRVGGRADWFLDSRSELEVAAAVSAARMIDLPVTLLGGGSNVLVSDAGVRGLVVRFRHGEIAGKAPGVVRAAGGVTLNGLIRWTINRGFAGLESWAGTPGTVGGAICGNAHFRGRLIGELVTAVGLLGRDGKRRCVPRDRMGFGYDHSRVQETGEAVLWAEFSVGNAPAADLRAEARSSLRFRKRSQPLDAPSAGCAFRNPDPDHVRLPADVQCAAGALIDGAGLKGVAVGGARVSHVHANFIVTGPGCRARDVRVLIERCRADVAARYGVTLASEVVFLGEFDASS